MIILGATTADAQLAAGGRTLGGPSPMRHECGDLDGQDLYVSFGKARALCATVTAYGASCSVTVELLDASGAPLGTSVIDPTRVDAVSRTLCAAGVARVIGKTGPPQCGAGCLGAIVPYEWRVDDAK